MNTFLLGSIIGFCAGLGLATYSLTPLAFNGIDLKRAREEAGRLRVEVARCRRALDKEGA